MSLATVKVIKNTLPPVRQINIMRQEILRLAQPVVKQQISRREQVTSAFTNKPEYESRIYIRNTVIAVVILLKNANQKIKGGNVTIGTLMEWLFETGTKPHIIRAKKGRALAFTGRGDKRIFRKQVFHPGFARSDQIEKIDKQFEPILANAIRAGGRIGLRKAKG